MTRTGFFITAAAVCKLAAFAVFAVIFVKAILGSDPVLAFAWLVLTAGFLMCRWEAIASIRKSAETDNRSLTEPETDTKGNF